jgi:DoxX-like family
MNTLIWIAQIILASFFIVTGTLKLFAFAPLVQSLQQRTHVSIAIVPVKSNFIGLVEIILGFGVLMPDIFTPEGFVPMYLIARLCAAALALLMVGTGIYRVRHKESAALAISVFLLALFVIVGRWPA